MIVAAKTSSIVIAPNKNVFIISLHDDSLFEKRAVERECFVLATFAAHIDAILLVHLHQVALHVFDRLAQMTLGRETQRSHLEVG